MRRAPHRLAGLRRRAAYGAAIVALAAVVLGGLPGSALAGSFPGTSGRCQTEAGFSVGPIQSAWITHDTPWRAHKVRLYELRIRRGASKLTMIGMRYRTVTHAKVWARNSKGKWLRIRTGHGRVTRRWLTLLFSYIHSTPPVPIGNVPGAKGRIWVQLGNGGGACVASVWP